MFNSNSQQKSAQAEVSYEESKDPPSVIVDISKSSKG